MLPNVINRYQNHHMDSTRWERYQPRAGDVVISTSIRSGTTWMQQIVRELILWDQPGEILERTPQMEASPWLDFRIRPLNSVIELLEAQEHRRFIKTHLALDGLPYYPQVKYILVARDARDVFMSLYNFYANFFEGYLPLINGIPERVGPPLSPCPADIHEAWRDWITRGWFDWESEGYPFWGNLHHTQTWWNYRHLENILFVHYNDLLDALPYEVRRIAHFLDIPISAEGVATLLPMLKLESMRHNGEQTMPGPVSMWKDGAQTFFFKGTNGRWRDVLTEDELTMYEAKAARVLTPDCRAWLEQGRVAWESLSVDTAQTTL
ncbi:MAG: sulfotransferase domain-containing protein [Caldilineaceae bacterium]|nr:sulfotransferase domain-containing protein [Caldilineaceae bacterium]